MRTLKNRYYTISTHAPAWGGDVATPTTMKNIAHFYSRPREGGDTVTDVDRYVAELFLLTPPRGGRRGTVCKTQRAG